MTLEQSILEAVRMLPPEKQQEVLEHVQKLGRTPGSTRPRWNGKGLWADLNVTLTTEEIDQNQREMWKNFPRDDF
jgi:hypothetical protein